MSLAFYITRTLRLQLGPFAITILIELAVMVVTHGEILIVERGWTGRHDTIFAHLEATYALIEQMIELLGMAHTVVTRVRVRRQDRTS